MPVVSRGIVYSLIAVVLVLLLGITALLNVSYHRHQRLEDVSTDFQRSLTQQENKIVDLQAKLANCDTIQLVAPVTTDSSWSSATSVKAPDSTKNKRQSPSPEW